MKKTYITTFAIFLFCSLACGLSLQAADEPVSFKPVPRMQAVPLPYDRVSYQRYCVELTQYHYGASLKRPFMYPIMGPSGRSLTRMGHPHDQETHKHHYSFWVSHNNVNGVVFWADSGEGRIVPKRIGEFVDGDDCCSTVFYNDWIDGAGKALMHETRRISVRPLEGKEWMLVLDLEFSPDKTDVVLGDTPFGMVGVRMAKTIGVHDGGGVIRNANGDVNEKQVFRKKTKWVDYCGRITNDAVEGITLFDCPSNPNFPAPFHVRNDGWMGACLTHEAPITLAVGKTLTLRYGLYVHNDLKSLPEIEKQWSVFTKIK